MDTLNPSQLDNYLADFLNDGTSYAVNLSVINMNEEGVSDQLQYNSTNKEGYLRQSIYSKLRLF